jgi:serine/threonine protein kinase
LKEHKSIHKIDPKEHFYLGVPVKCSVARTTANVQIISQCKDGPEFLEQLDKLSLLIMKNGGDNFSQFAKKAKKWSDNEANGKQIEMFWIECHRILLGIKAFLSNDIIHQDLKPQNLVYNEIVGRVNFIDFGHMDRKSKMIEACKKSVNYNASYHWSYPWEYHLLNNDDYKKFANLNKMEKESQIEHLMYKIKEKNDDDDGPNAIRHFLSSYSDSKLKDVFLTEYSAFLLKDITMDNYDKLLNKTFDTVDVYGTGMAFMYVLLNTQHLVDVDFVNKMTQLCFNMTRPNVFLRFGIDDVLSEFESILFSSGILAKNHKKLENHQIKDVSAKPLHKKHVLDSLNLFVDETKEPIVKEPVKHSSILKIYSNQKNRRKTVRFNTCGPGRFLNTSTNRCKTYKKQE